MASRLFEIIKDFVNNKQNRIGLLFWALPLISALICQGLGFGWNRLLLKNFIENSALLIILLSLSLLFNTKWRQFFQALGYVVFVFTNLLESIYFYLFKANLSASSIFILLETNVAEAREFAEFYLSPVIIFMLFLFLSFLIVFFIVKPFIKITPYYRFQKWIYALGIVLPLVLMIYKGYQQYNFLYLSVESVFEYIDEQEKMSQYNIDKPLADISGFKLKKQVDTATYVLVIGESTTRRRMSVYGYDRQTTPFLDSLKSDLWLYKDVISSHAFTIGALKDALTLNSLSTDTDFSIIQLMNQAGFKTFWISNQRPIGQYESLVTQIALGSDKYLTKNTALDGSITPHDEVLLPEFQKALKDTAAKKFIVLHPLGTHLLYSDRYPESFEKFKGKSPAKFDHPQAHQRSNSYDNAVLYHDYFLKEVHQSIARLKHPSYLFYFADHGDEVYESIDFSGHVDENPTKSMYDIPFFIWMNQAFKTQSQLQYFPQKPYRLKDFMHSLSDLNGIYFKQYDSTKSIFSNHTKFEKRKVGNGLFYQDLP